MICGSNNIISTYMFNLTTRQYQLHQLIVGIVTNGCSALDFSTGEDSVAVGSGENRFVLQHGVYYSEGTRILTQ